MLVIGTFFTAFSIRTYLGVTRHATYPLCTFAAYRICLILQRNAGQMFSLEGFCFCSHYRVRADSFSIMFLNIVVFYLILVTG